MAKTTQKAVNSAKKTKKINWANAWKETKLGAYTALTSTKILGVGGLGAYLITTGMNKTDVVYMACGAILAGYAIVILVSTTHISTKVTKA